MWSGRQAFERIEGAILNLHRQETELDSALASATAEAERLRRERADAFRELARIKLDEITAQRLVEDLDAAEARARQLLEGRRRQLEDLAAERQSAIAELEKAEGQRSSAAGALENTIHALNELRSKIAETIKSSSEWLSAKAALEAAESVAKAAEEKATQSESEVLEKRRPYDQDPLFAYLWKTGFGTQHYQAGRFARFMDRMTARYINFADARLNYAMLIEMPVRLREHARLQREIVGQMRTKLQEIERKALSEAGEDVLARAVDEARRKLADADAVVEKIQAALRSVDQKRDAVITGAEDVAYREALQIIASADAQDHFETLVNEAKRTATPADDAIVRRIGELNSRIDQIDSEIAELRKSARTVAERRVEVERARDRFRKSGYDHPDATFENDIDLDRVLGQVLGGVVTGGVLWDLLRKGFGLSHPRRGGMTFPFPFPIPLPDEGDGPRGGDWRNPDSRGPWSPKRRDRDGDGDEDDDHDDEWHRRRGRFETGGRF